MAVTERSGRCSDRVMMRGKTSDAAALAAVFGEPAHLEAIVDGLEPVYWDDVWGRPAGGTSSARREIDPQVPVLDLPVDQPQRHAATDEIGAVVVSFPEHLAAEPDPGSVLLAAWRALLFRLSGADEVPVVRSGVVECVDFAGRPSAGELIGRTGTRVEADSAQAAFEFEDFRERVPGVDAQVWRYPAAVTANVALATRRVGSCVTGEVAFRKALFSPWLAVRFARWLLALIEGMRDTSVPVHAIPLESVLEMPLNGPVRKFPVHRPMHRFIEDSVDRTPSAVAVVAPDRVLTYEELERRANGIAHRLLALGVGRDEPVAVLLESGTDLVCAMTAVVKAGGAYLPLDAGYPAARIDDVARSAQVRVVLTVREFADRAAGADRHVVALDDPGVLDGLSTGRPQVDVRPDQLHHVIFTSGSTGKPKGVAVEHRSVVNYVHAVLERLGDVAGKSFAVVSTPAADFGLTCIFGALTTGGTVHLVARETALDPVEFAGYLAEHEVDVLKCVPSHLQLLAAAGDIAKVLPRELLVMSGEPCSWSLVERISAVRPELRVQSHYGHTESTMVSFVCETDKVSPRHRTGNVPLGTPLANISGHLLDRFGAPVPAGLPGELVMTGPGVSRGYLGLPKLTAEKFFVDPALAPTRCYRSGDRLRIDADGTLLFAGRVDDQVKIRGHRVEPGEVTVVLRAAPGVSEAVVVAVGDGAGRMLAAWIVAPAADIAAVRRHLRAQLPEFMVPASITILAKMPLTENGKIDRSALVIDDSRDASRTGPRTPTEREVAAAWQAVLEVDDVGAFDDFFALGGDSLAAVRAIRVLDRRVRVIDLVVRPTVTEFARFLDEQDTGDTGLLHRFHSIAGRVRATLVCVPYGGGSAAAFQALSAELGDRGVQALAVELPGHDPSRLDEPLETLPEVARQLAGEILREVDGPVALYGHCVGAATAVEVAHLLVAAGKPPIGVVVGGAMPAAPMPGTVALSALFGPHRQSSDAWHRDVLRATGGLPAGIDPRNVRAAVRGTKHDAWQAEQWYAIESRRTRTLPLPLLCLVAEDDRVTDLYQERHGEWRWFAERVDLAVLRDAGHYFASHRPAGTADEIVKWLEATPGEPAETPASQPSVLRAGIAAIGHTAALTTAVVTVLAYAVGNPTVLALLTLFAAARPLGRGLVEQVAPRAVVVSCDVGLAAGAALVPVAGPWRAAAIAAVVLAAAVRQPAWFATMVKACPKRHRAQLRALSRRSWPLIWVAGGLGVLLGVPGPILALVALLAGVAIRPPDLVFRKQGRGFGDLVLGGARFLRNRSPLAGLLLLRTGALLGCGAALDALSPPQSVTAAVAGGLSLAAGKFLASRWGLSSRVAGVLLSLFVVGIAIVAGGTFGIILGGLAAASIDEHWWSFVQTKTGERLLPDVRALALLFGAPAFAAGLAIGSYTETAFVGGAMMVLAIAGIRWRRADSVMLDASVASAGADELTTIARRAGAATRATSKC